MSVGKASKRRKGPITEAPGNRGRLGKGLKPPRESSSKGSLQKTTAIITLVPILILLLVSFAVYFNALSGAFVFDDKTQIVDNPWIRDTGNIPTIFSKSVSGYQSKRSTSNYYRPLMHIVYMLNYHVFGLKPWGFHLVNILFHCGATVLVFLIIRRFLSEHGVTTSLVYLSPPFIAAMLFASHPIHTEAVTWIAGLPDVAFTFFYLLSLYLYISFRDGAKGCYPLSVLSFSVALLFKEPALTLPIVVIIYDCLLGKRDETLLVPIKRYIPYGVVSGIYLLARYHALGSLAPIESYAGLSAYEFIINVLPLFREYLTGLLWPFHLNLWHTFHPITSLFEARGMISVFVAVIFFVAAVSAYRKSKVLFFGLLLLVIPLLPALYIKGIGWKPYAERYLYLPSVGYVLLAAVFLSWADEKLPRAAKSISMVFILLVGIYTVGTITRNNVWKDSFTLWSETARESPDSPVAHCELGLTYLSQGQFDRAIAEFQTAIRLKPDYAEAHVNLANAYGSQGQLDRAIAESQTVIRLQPGDAVAHNNLGAAYGSQGQMDRAIAEFQTTVRLKPDYAEAHYNLGAAYLAQGQLDRAIAEFQTAIRLTPDDAESHYSLGAAYVAQGQLDRAIAEFQTVLRLRPNDAKARARLNEIVSRRTKVH